MEDTYSFKSTQYLDNPYFLFIYDLLQASVMSLLNSLRCNFLKLLRFIYMTVCLDTYLTTTFLNIYIDNRIRTNLFRLALTKVKQPATLFRQP